jgi:hypothetical protein
MNRIGWFVWCSFIFMPLVNFLQNATVQGKVVTRKDWLTTQATEIEHYNMRH